MRVPSVVWSELHDKGRGRAAGVLAAVLAWTASVHAQAPDPDPAASPSADPAVRASAALAGSAGASESSAAAAGDADTRGAAEADDELAWDLRHRGYSTITGSTGGIFIADPGMAHPGSLRLQFTLDTYSGDDFLFDGDEVEQNRQYLSASWTALESLELFASLHNRSTVADEPRPNSLHVFGDIGFGAKVGTDVGKIFRVGGSARFMLFNDIGMQETLLDATNIGLTALAAMDLQRLDDPLPLIARLNVDYLFDNSAEVARGVERRRYQRLEDPEVPENEIEHLINRVERFGLGVNRVDMFTAGVGVELPIQIGDDSYLHPVADFRIGIPINRQDYDCPYYSTDPDRGTTEPGADDTCLDDADFDVYPVELALGARFVPAVRGLSLLAGVNLGLSGTDTFVRELAPTPPFRLMLMVGYDYDAEPPPPPPAPPPPPPPPPAAGRVLGRVVDQGSGAPIEGALVGFAGRELTPVATGPEGRFASYELEPGEVQLEVSHPDYQAGSCGATIPSAGGDVETECALEPLPVEATLEGRVRDPFGVGVAGVRVRVTGPSTHTATSGPDGEFAIEGVAPGPYTLHFESDDHFSKVERVNVEPRESARVEAVVLPRPSEPTAEVRDRQIRVGGLEFEAGSAELGPEASQAVAEVADLLLRQPAIQRVRIEANGEEGLALSRALAIKQRLVDLGISDARIEVGTEPVRTVTISIAE